MIILDGDTEKIQLVLASAVTANALQWVSSWGLLNETAFEQYDGGGGTSNDTTDVDLVAGVAGKQVAVLGLSIYNADTVNATVTIKKDVSGTEYVIHKTMLVPGQSLVYSKDGGFTRPDVYPPLQVFNIHSDAGANFAMTNATQAERFANGATRMIFQVDLAGYSQVRLRGMLQTGSASANTPIFRARYYNAYSVTVGNYLQLGESEQVEWSVVNSGYKDTGWIDLASGAKADGIYICFTELGGDGAADPATGFVQMFFR